MVVGVVSNTEGRLEAMEAAAQTLRALGVEWIIHCGDVGGRHVLDAFRNADVDAAFVWGDQDRDRMGLLRYAQKEQIQCFGVLADLEIDGKRIAVVHGDDKKVLKRLLDEQQYDFIFHGHGHASEDKMVGRTRLVHPGSLYGAPKRTAGVVDLSTNDVKLLEI
ncbi:MAG TPA: YfcE family phosphodiesterase [Tepidisphaeraceae bacterium]|jgi:putative phosphoesterase